MKITHGLLAGQVLQRNAKNRGSALVTGTARACGTVELRVTKGGKTLRGQDWHAVGSADGKAFCAQLSNLAAGGPYDVELRIGAGKGAESIAVREVFVGDVWFMGGQSNMQGCGNRVAAPRPHPMVRAFYMRDAWGVAEEPMHLLSEAVDTFHNGYGDGPKRPSDTELARIRKAQLKGVSPGHSFGIEMFRRTGVPQGLVACAHGGTSMAQWSPELRSQGGASLYGAMMRRFEKLGQPLRGIIWYQGESDANVEAAKVYTKRMIELVAATRRDMGLPKLAWLIVQIGCHVARDNGEWNDIQEQQRLLPEQIDRLDVAPAIDLPLDDGIHINGVGQNVLGKRLARLADRIVFRHAKSKPSIRLKGVEVSLRAVFPGEPVVPLVTVTYDHVAGKLTSQGLPAGFVLHNIGGTPLDAIYKTRLQGNKVLIETNLPFENLASCLLSYGNGRYSYCNVTDAEGMSLPVMHQVPLSGCPYLPFVLGWTAARLSATGTIGGVSLKKALGAKGWKEAATEQGFVVLPRPLTENRDGVWTLRTTVTAAKACEVVALFGSDSPFAMWINGKEVVRDAKAINPCVPSQYRKKVHLEEGKNEVVAVFDSRKGMGWGICLRFESTPKGPDLRDILQYPLA